MTTLRYSWRRSTPGINTSFGGTDGLLQFAWIGLLTSGSDEGQWSWDLTGLQFDGHSARGHMAGTPREVAAFVEAEYDRLLPQAAGLNVRHDIEAQHYAARGIKLPPMAQWRNAVFVDGMPAAEADALYRPDYSPATLGTTHSRRSRR